LSHCARVSHCATGIRAEHERSAKAVFAPVDATQSDEADPTAAA